MHKFKNILMPVDFSDQTLPMFKYALKLASHEDSQIHILNVNEMSSMSYPGSAYSLGLVNFNELEDYIGNWAKEEYVNLLKRVSIEKPHLIKFHQIKGRVADEIVNFADSNHADVILMATHSRTKLEDLFLGSRTERVLHLTNKPVIVLREPNIAPEFPPKHFLVTTDYSLQSAKIFGSVVSLAKEYGSKVTVLSVDSYDDGFLEKLDETQLMILRRPFEELGDQVSFETVRAIHSVNGITDYLKDHKEIDMAAMATHGRSGLGHIMLGSTTEAIIRQTRIPVMVIRSKK